jgi:ribose 5-phosphate isomerase B
MPGGTIAVASDHAGFDLKEILKRDLQAAGHEVLDFGTNSAQSVDYPDFGQTLAEAIAAVTPDGLPSLPEVVCHE